MKETSFFRSNYWLSFWSSGRPLLVFLFLLSLVFGSCQEKNYAKVPEESKELGMTQEQKVTRGKYLVTTIGCADCHSPKQFNEKGFTEIEGLELSGYQQGQELPVVSGDALEKGWMLMNHDLTAAAGPWGVSFAANITSDETGIGTWSYDQFKTAMRKGKYKGMENARDLLPPMPWFNFAKLTDEDLEAMYHYLQSTAPVENIVPAPIPPTKLVMN